MAHTIKGFAAKKTVRVIDGSHRTASILGVKDAGATKLGLLLFVFPLVAGLGLSAPANAGGVTQTRTIDAPQNFAGIFIHGAPVLVPDPAAPPGAGALIDQHKIVFAPGANWVQETSFSTFSFRRRTSAAGATEIRHQIAPHREARTGLKLFGVSTARQVFPIPGAPGFALGFDVENKSYKHGGHADNYQMLILAGFRNNNVTGYLGFLAGQHSVPIKKTYYTPMGPDESYVADYDRVEPPIGGAMISLDKLSGKKGESNLVMIAAMGVSEKSIKGAYIYSGTPEKPGDILVEWGPEAFQGEAAELGVILIQEIILPGEVLEAAMDMNLFVKLDTRSGSLIGQFGEMPEVLESPCDECKSK